MRLAFTYMGSDERERNVSVFNIPRSRWDCSWIPAPLRDDGKARPFSFLLERVGTLSLSAPGRIRTRDLSHTKGLLCPN